METTIQQIEHRFIHPNPDNPRIEAGDVTVLAASIREQGIKQPLLVIPAPLFGDGHFMLEDGYRRWVASRNILYALPCQVRVPHPDENLAVSALITGLVTDTNENLTAMEKSKAYSRLRKEGMTQAQIARAVGVHDSTVARYLALDELAPAAQERVRKGTLSVDNALDAVKRHRATGRKKEGKKPIDPGWDPDHFTRRHHLARKAETMCNAREHNGRRRLGREAGYDGACGQCWETCIRQDQSTVDRVEYQGMGFDVPFIAPVMTAGTKTATANHRQED